MMKTLVVLACLAACAVAMPVFSNDMVQSINADPTSTWEATTHNQFASWTVEDVSSMLGLKPEMAEKYTAGISSLSPHLESTLKSLPSEFDARKQWPKCEYKIRNQGKCGSCWAFASSETLTDRMCIASDAKFNEPLSPEHLVACDHTCKFIVLGCDNGCGGGLPANAWKYMTKSGISTEKCFSYKELDGDHKTQCASKCDDGSEMKLYKAKSSYTFSSADDMMADLVKNGPITVGFKVYQDFMSYKSGVYQHKTGAMLGGHAVKIVGYGTENGVDYWLVANSWDTTWGIDGYFKIARGKDECGIETMASVAGLADTSSL